jgi:hypothetical protein
VLSKDRAGLELEVIQNIIFIGGAKGDSRKKNNISRGTFVVL